MGGVGIIELESESELLDDSESLEELESEDRSEGWQNPIINNLAFALHTRGRIRLSLKQASRFRTVRVKSNIDEGVFAK